MRAVSIYAAIGGASAVSAAVDDFYRRVLADPELAGYFIGVDVDRVKAHQRLFIAAAIGGPAAYRGRPMREAHAGLHVRDEDFDRVVGHLAATLTSLGADGPTIAMIADTLVPLAKSQRENPTAFIENTAVFGDLASDPRFVEAYAWALDSLHRDGARATLETLLRKETP